MGNWPKAFFGKARSMSESKRKRPVLFSLGEVTDTMAKDLTKYVPTKQAAKMLGVNRFWIARLLTEERLKGIKVGRDWLVFVPSIERYRDTKSKRGRPPSRVPQMQ
jgi:excisionase family DNA binding protein